MITNNSYRIAVPLALKTVISQTLYELLQQIAALLNGRISLGNGNNGTQSGNVVGRYIDVITPSTVNSDFTIKHDLKYVPSCYLVVSAEQNCAIPYLSPSLRPTTTDITLRVNTSSATIKLWIF